MRYCTSGVWSWFLRVSAALCVWLYHGSVCSNYARYTDARRAYSIALLMKPKGSMCRKLRWPFITVRITRSAYGSRFVQVCVRKNGTYLQTQDTAPGRLGHLKAMWEKRMSNSCRDDWWHEPFALSCSIMPCNDVIIPEAVFLLGNTLRLIHPFWPHGGKCTTPGALDDVAYDLRWLEVSRLDFVTFQKASRALRLFESVGVFTNNKMRLRPMCSLLD